MTSFELLSAELKLTIIDHLHAAQVSPSPTNGAPGRAARREGERAAAQQKAADDAVFRNLLNLSCVNRELRVLVEPHLFASITLSNSERGGASIGFVSKSRAAASVRTLHYKADINALPAYVGAAYPERSAVPWTPDHFPDAVRDVLENLSRFSRLERLIVEFTIETEVLGSMLDCGSDFGEVLDGGVETDQGATKAEETQAWRALMRRAYLAIARNPPGTVKHLELRNVLPKSILAWLDPTWHALLGHLDGFSLSLRNFDGGIGMHVSGYSEFRKLARGLPEYFLDHLHRATSFEFECQNGGIGAEDFNTSPFPFLEHHVPMLQHLTLRYLLISKQLRDTLCAKKTLKTLHLVDCAASQSLHLSDTARNQNEISWAEFFESLCRNQNSQLCAIEMKILKLRKWMEYQEDEIPEMLKDTPWVYGYTADKYCDLVMADEETWERWEMGEDARAWQRLVCEMEHRKCEA